MIHRVSRRGRGQLRGMGDDVAAAGARKSYPQLAAELAAVLDQVETNDQARALGLKAFTELQGLLSRLGGWVSASMVRDYLQPSLDHLGRAMVAMPLLGGDQPVGDEWFGVPDGLRRAIQDAASSTWALQRVVPEGNLDAEDLRTFVEGFADTLRWELGGITGVIGKIASTAVGGLTDGLGIPGWAVWAGAGVLALLLLPKLNQLRKVVSL